MKYKKIRNYLGSILFSMIIVSCTDLTETVYDQIVTENYYNTKDDVIRAAFRPFEHAYWSIGSRFTINEETTDQLGTWNRDGWWVDGQIWQRYHYHTWTIDEMIFLSGMLVLLGLCRLVLYWMILKDLILLN